MPHKCALLHARNITTAVVSLKFYFAERFCILMDRIQRWLQVSNILNLTVSVYTFQMVSLWTCTNTLVKATPSRYSLSNFHLYLYIYTYIYIYIFTYVLMYIYHVHIKTMFTEIWFSRNFLHFRHINEFKYTIFQQFYVVGIFWEHLWAYQKPDVA